VKDWEVKDWDWAAMVGEELDPELEGYLELDGPIGPMVRHPLVYDISLQIPGAANRRLAYKKEALAEALSKKDWDLVVSLHERPHRFNALQEYVLRPGVPIWRHSKAVKALAEWVWTDSENISQHQAEWLALYEGRPEGAVLGEPIDLVKFQKLPEQVTLYRGGGADSFLSWSTSREVSERFAARSKSKVRSRVVPKSEIFAYYTQRGEFEALTFAGMGE